MSCTICGAKGHNARSCPYRDKDVPRDHALWMKFDNMTQREAADLQSQIMRDKNRIAPEARGTSAKGKKSELPARIHHALNLLGGGNGSKAK